MSYEKVVAVYDTEANANAALKTLQSAGYLTDDILGRSFKLSYGCRPVKNK
jgi:hypothetical protein